MEGTHVEGDGGRQNEPAIFTEKNCPKPKWAPLCGEVTNLHTVSSQGRSIAPSLVSLHEFAFVNCTLLQSTNFSLHLL